MIVRSVLFFLGCVAFALALGFRFQQSWATSLWPWPDTPLTYTFVGAIAAAVGASTLWVSRTGELGAAAAGSIALMFILGGSAASLALFAQGDPHLLPFAGAFAAGAIVLLGVLLWARRQSIHDARPMPRLVMASFVAFVLVLLVTGVTLVAQTPHVLPWVVSPETSTLLGWIFIGDGCLFLWGALQKKWHSAASQLLAFLAYDLVLLGPIIGHWAVATPDQFLGLAFYIAVLVYSGLLACFYLFINPGTRMWSPEQSSSGARSV